MERYRIINGQRYELHHTATATGYMSRKVPEKLEEYKGRFGIGYKVHRPRYDTAKYHYVDYYVGKGGYAVAVEGRCCKVFYVFYKIQCP